MSSFSSSPPSGQHTSSTSRWESLVTRSRCDPPWPPSAQPPDSPPHLSQPEAPEDSRKSQPAPSSNSFPVEILMTPNHVFNTQISCCLFDVVGWYYCFFCFVLFFFSTHYKKNKYYFVRFVLPPRKYFEVFDKLPHFSNGSCVCTLFLLTFYYFCEILHLLLLYR